MEMITRETKLGGMSYPFFQPLGDWELTIESVKSPDEYKSKFKHRTVAWISDNKISTLYSDWGWKKFQAHYNLKTHTHKGLLQLCKRMSRVFRPMFLWGFFYNRDLNIRVKKSLDTKTWDGAGLVSRKMLQKMLLTDAYLSLPLHKKAQLRQQINNAKRVEFTVLDRRGQMKGHALVVEQMQEDIVLPKDVKTELSMNNGQTFVSFDFPHAADHMMIDAQSLINLGEFIPIEDYGRWLDQHNDAYLDSMVSGVAQSNIALSYNDENPWWLADYFRSGGRLEWFRAPLLALARQHEQTIIGKALGE